MLIEIRTIALAAACVTAALSQAKTQAPTARAAAAQRAVERVVFRAFPEADAYAGIVRDLDQRARRRVEGSLPFKVHFDELGAHELLVAFRGRRPVGLVYRRTEDGEWGLAEIAWHIGLDGRITGFRFLRGRSRSIGDVERGRLRDELAGADIGRVSRLLAEHDRRHAAAAADRGVPAITRTTLRSAAKTLVVLGVVWGKEIEKLRDQATGFDEFPTASRFTRRTTTFGLRADEATVECTAKVLFAYDAAGELIGCVAWTDTERAEGSSPPTATHGPLRWVLDRDLRVLAVRPLAPTVDVALRRACTELEGHALTEPPTATERSSRAAALVPTGLALATVIHELRRGRRTR